MQTNQKSNPKTSNHRRILTFDHQNSNTQNNIKIETLARRNPDMDWVRRETIGYGSFSTVSLATPSKNSTTFFPSLMAVKSAASFGAASLENERAVLEELGDCPEILRCFSDDKTVEDGEEMYNLLLEYASKGSLENQVKRFGGKGLPENDVRRHTRSALRGLRHVHAKGFAHLDIKLGNLLMFDDGSVKIADFGLAEKTEEKQGSRKSGAEIRGTPLYMAPETVNDNEYGSAADVWALGCAVVEMASGKPAWSFKDGSNVMALLIRIGVGNDLPMIPEELSDEGKDFLSKCFVRDPRERWTADMLLSHPFVAVDCKLEEEEKEEEVTVVLRKGEEEEVSTSPRCPFDYPDWVSVSSYSSFDSSLSSCFPSPEERIRSLVTDRRLDWSVSDSWVTVRGKQSRVTGGL